MSDVKNDLSDVKKWLVRRMSDVKKWLANVKKYLFDVKKFTDLSKV